jgi:hypothetical protein
MPTRIHDRSAAGLRRAAGVDDALARAAARGERQAFDRVYDALFPLVWQMSVRRAHGSKRDAERLTVQILQDVVRCLEDSASETPTRATTRR